MNPTPRLERSHEDRIIAGVAAGLGRRFAVNPWWFRVAFLILSVGGGLGVLLYLAGWLLIPEEGESKSVASSFAGSLEGAGAWIGAGLIALAALVVLGWLDWFGEGLVFGAILLVFGVLLYRGDLSGRRGSPPSPPPSGDTPPDDAATTAMATDTRLEETTASSLADGGERFTEGGETPPPSSPPPVAQEPARPAPPPPPARPSRPRSILGRVTFAAILIVLGVIGIVDALVGYDLRFAHYVAATVATIGVGLLVGAWYGRARWLIPVGILLLPVLAVASVVRVPLIGEWGDQTYRVSAGDVAAGTYEMSGGALRIDLRDMEVDSGQTIEVDADLGIGELTVVLPAGVGAEIAGDVGIGNLDIPGYDRGGLGLDRVVTLDGEGLILLGAEVGIGRVHVYRIGN